MNPSFFPRGRFAPSPSGRMHLGNLFCALIAWLSIRSQQGTLVLRVEDLDPARCRRAYQQQLEEDLLWLGLGWDEGGLSSSAAISYCQSERSSLYAKAAERLSASGLLYPCFCSRDELHAAAAPHHSDGVLRYSGTCRTLTLAERSHRAVLRAPASRLIVPHETLSFVDGCRGEQRSHLAEDCGDFIIRRSDGVFAYQLAVVVDDGLMGITEVVRGGDLLDSTPRQLYLYQLLGYPPPQFYHLPLLLSTEGRRLSKRDRDLDCGVLRQRFSPEELLGRLGFLAGLTDTATPSSLATLLSHFSWDCIPKQDMIVPPALFMAQG